MHKNKSLGLSGRWMALHEPPHEHVILTVRVFHQAGFTTHRSVVSAWHDKSVSLPGLLFVVYIGGPISVV